MVKKLLEWFKVTHEIGGLKINVRQFKNKALEFYFYDDYIVYIGWFE